MRRRLFDWFGRIDWLGQPDWLGPLGRLGARGRLGPLGRLGRLSRRALLIIAGSLVVVAAGLGVGLGFLLTAGSSVGPRLTASFQDASTGIHGRHPAGWRLERRGGGFAITSPDRSALVEIAAPAAAAQAGAVLTDTVSVIGHDYTNVRVLSRPRRRIDHLSADGVVLSAQNQAGVPLRVLVTTAAGRSHAYLLEVFTTDRASTATVVDTQAVINALRLTG